MSNPKANKKQVAKIAGIAAIAVIIISVCVAAYRMAFPPTPQITLGEDYEQDGIVYAVESYDMLDHGRFENIPMDKYVCGIKLNILNRNEDKFYFYNPNDWVLLVDDKRIEPEPPSTEGGKMFCLERNDKFLYFTIEQYYYHIVLHNTKLGVDFVIVDRNVG